MKPLALVIDHDAGTRKLLDVLLTRFGYEVDRVAESADARALLERIDYDFILSEDEVVAKWISVHRPDALGRLMILSSATETQYERMRRDWANVRVARKPFELADVIEASRQAAANRPLREPQNGESFWRHSATNGAKSGVVVRRSGDVLELVTSYGHERAVLDEWFPIPVSDPYPLCATIRNGRPVWLASIISGHDYPLLETIWQTNQTRALAVAPILRGGVAIGGVGWTFRDAQRFTEPEKRTWLSIAEGTMDLVDGGTSTESSSSAGA